MSADLTWSRSWENDLTPAEHDELGDLLARSFSRARVPFGPGRSWGSARPELRVVGERDGTPVAHIAIVRRFLQVGGVSQLVGDVGLVGVDPDMQGRGVGAALLAATTATLRELDLPFGFLSCGHHVLPFYVSGGWREVPARTRLIGADGLVEVYPGAAVVLPVGAAMAEWPVGDVERNGLEV